MNLYVDREQTEAKHFILRGYLQELAFKVLRTRDITYVDGFSGPWESKTKTYSDTSFMIAIGVLKDAQQKVFEQTGTRRRIGCFFSEKDPKAYAQMETAVAEFHQPNEKFEIKTYHGEFVNAVDKIKAFVGISFPLIFIDPTGWTDYPFAKIAPLFKSRKCEVLINFMYGHISRFVTHPDEKIIASLDPILGGPEWKDRLDTTIKRGPAVEKLFRETLKAEGNFEFVVSTKIDKSTEERPHFFLAYATKDRAGLKAFREIEYNALRSHARSRSGAIARKRELKTGNTELFTDHEADRRAMEIEDLVLEQKKLAKLELIASLEGKNEELFLNVVSKLLQAYLLRETNVKDICCDLARDGQIRNTWGGGNRKPTDNSKIILLKS